MANYGLWKLERSQWKKIMYRSVLLVNSEKKLVMHRMCVIL